MYCIVEGLVFGNFYQFFLFFIFFLPSLPLFFLFSLSLPLCFPPSLSLPPSPSPAPMAPVNFRATEINFTSVSLVWDPPDVPNGIITKYHVSISLLVGVKPPSSSCICLCACLPEWSFLIIHFRSIAVLNNNIRKHVTVRLRPLNVLHSS